MGDNTYAVLLTAEELVLLDGKVNPKAQEVVDKAKKILGELQTDEFANVPSEFKEFLARIKLRAETELQLKAIGTALYLCDCCGAFPQHPTYKTGPKKGKPNYNKPRGTLYGTDFSGVKLCNVCRNKYQDVILEALKGIKAELPEFLFKTKSRYHKYGNRKCKKCGWAGHEGQMGRLRTLMNDGTYPGVCPSCKARNELFLTEIDSVPGFVLVDQDGTVVATRP